MNVLELRAVYTSEVRLVKNKAFKGEEAVIIKDSKIAQEVIKAIYETHNHQLFNVEVFGVLGLDRSNRVLFEAIISIGGIAATAVDLKILFKHLILNHCSGFIMFHNHPSGRLKPSPSDILITEKAKKIGECLEMVLLDHVIVTEDDCYSFSDEEIL